MKKTIALLAALCLLLPVLPGCAGTEPDPGPDASVQPAEETGTVLYVSPDGDDAADGTAEHPLATLAGARDKVRALLPAADDGITVYFRGGEYPVTGSVTFTAEDSGSEGAPVTYRAYPGETPVFTGGVTVDPARITRVTDESVLARVNDPAAREALMQADLSDITDALPPVYTLQRTENDAYYPVLSYIGDSRLALARWPNSDTLFGSSNYVSMTRLVREDDDPDGTANNTFYYGDDVAERVATWSDESLADLYLEGWFVGAWFHDRFDVSGLDREARSFRTKFGTTDQVAFYYTCQNVNFINLPEEIDLPGESYTDTEKRIVYFYPTDNFGTDPFIVGLGLEGPVLMDGASHLVFEGFTFEYTRMTPIRGYSVRDITIRDCVITHTGAQAIRMFDAEDIDIDGCTITDLSSGAIMLSGGDRTTLTPSNNVIENCDIWGVNRDGSFYDDECREITGQQNINEAVYFTGCGYTIRHNRLHDSPQEFMHFLANDVVIEYNEIYDCCRETSDNAAVGYNRNASELGVIIRYNYFHDIQNRHTGVGQFAVYCDDGVIGPQMYGNLFVLAEDPGKVYTEGETYHELSPVLLNGAQYTVFTGNIVAGHYEWGVRFGSWSRGQGSVQGEWSYRLFDWAGWEDNLLSVDALSEIWQNHYAGTSWGHLYDTYTAENLEKFNSITDEKARTNFARSIAPYFTNEVTGNVFVGTKDPPCEGGMNTHDNYQTSDLSVFTDFDGGDYSFTEEALAAIREVCPDFEPLSLSDVGPQK